MQNFRELKVWQKSHQLVIDLYEHTSSFPREEIFGLTSQVRRASSSIPANIAEGCGRGTSAALTSFLRIAAGSASELEYHLLLARDLGFLSPQAHEPLERRTREIKRMLASFLKAIQRGREQPPSGDD